MEHGLTPQLYISTRYDRLLDALHDAQERASLEAQLPGYLLGQRWFGGQARGIKSVELERWVHFEVEDISACLCVVLVMDTAGRETEHQMFLYVDAPAGNQRPVVDALALEPIRADLLQLALTGGSREGHRAKLAFEPTGVTSEGCGGSGRLVGAEQSNTSMTYDDSCVLKVYRRLERGNNPEVEIGHYLTTEADFAATPQLVSIGKLEGTDGYGADAIAVQRFVPNQGDGWQWAVSAARTALDAVPDPAGMLDWLHGEQVTLRAAATLGRVTARLHAALAGATGSGMQPEPVSDQDLQDWSAALHQEAQDTASVVRRVGAGDPTLTASIERAAAYAGEGIQLSEPADAGLKIRVHGDYHLGQVLKTEDGFVVLDFEGEPVKTLAQRRALQHPLVDVAGMARSWSYAAYAAVRESRGVHLNSPTVEALALSWEAAVRRSFLDAYWTEAASSHPQFLPKSPQTREELLTCFELRKALYEVQYELNNRPDWVEIPAVAVRRLVEGLDI